jgi:hypothetical protein
LTFPPGGEAPDGDRRRDRARDDMARSSSPWARAFEGCSSCTGVAVAVLGAAAVAVVLLVGG